MKNKFLLQIKMNNEKGFALVIVMLVLSVLSLLGLGLLGLVMNNVKMSSGERDFQSSYYIAEAGVNQGTVDIKKLSQESYKKTETEIEFYQNLNSSINNYNKSSKSTIQQFETSFGEKPVANIEIKELSKKGSYEILSTGTIDQRTRKVKRVINVSWVSKSTLNIPNDIAVYAENNISLKGGANINGNIGTSSEEANSIELKGGSSINGDVYVPLGAENIAVDAPHYMNVPKPKSVESPKKFELPPFPSYPNPPLYPNQTVKKSEWNQYEVVKDGDLRIDNWMVNDYTLSLEKDVKFNEIRLTSNNSLTVNIGDQHRSIVVEHLNISNGTLDIKGTGSLTIYVKEEITMGSGSILNGSEEVKKLNIFLADSQKTKKFKVSGDQKIYGSIYVEKADIDISGGGEFRGHIFTGGDNFKVSGGALAAAPSLLYAPNASFVLSGGGKVYGSIISKDFSGVGGTNVWFDGDLDLSYLPFIPSGDSELPENMITKEPVREVS
ncbi:DUF7305 domain-containing protein [Pontibacillus yanchengensis]|uniref:Uncharacterized protein n=1 Tax=Pontibacillus yanchengensis Y32 TaxID=1385514 RepID=A0A0A2T9Z4_9BACI|nr:PilX N-terminal domain-containing pilus assembly protein [Pontibacillus yanchengensis]KGP72657.1 hypothetical protein N782_11240 [Pontibacillus yanchengensis Y32]